MTDLDVLIVGGGPTGLVLALELSIQKIPFRIINKAPERSPYSRALVVQPRTQELLNRYGNVRELRSTGFRAVGTTIAVNGKKIADIHSDFKGITPTQFPSPMAISQAETEGYLDRVLAKHGAAVEMGVEAKSIEPDSNGVTVVLVSQDGREETVRAKYVVGADGSHSSVRHAAKTLTFDGDAYPQEFVLADVHIKSDMPTERAYLCLTAGVCVVLPLSDSVVRLIVSRPNQPNAGAATLQDFQQFLNEVYPGKAELYDPIWLTSFRLHHRIVSNYREGRLLLAGDAAHIHSPAGGQGMNTGIQDSINLGWKLAAVLRGEKPDSFLDTYNEERRRVGEYLLHNSDRVFSFMTSMNSFFLWLRNLILPWVLPWVVSNPQRVLNSLRFMTQFGIKYRRSPIVGTAPGFNGPVKGGYRAVEGSLRGPEGEKYLQDLLTPESHHLLLFSGVGSAAASEGDLHRAEAKFLEASHTQTKVHTIFGHDGSEQSGWVDIDGATHQSYGFDKPGYVLVRPDSYVAHIGPLSALDDLVTWLQ
ncbi:putative FAD binding domain-containing protein [Seiridium cardinale]|uniref:FAD binding domain-containing protein n=1 Tax=Seiridium cardinale TaxID=138064 RepID=A0ABR2XJT5_9PEZI